MLMMGGAAALVVLAAGCAQPGAAGGPPADKPPAGDAIVALDPDNPPDPGSSEVHLLVTEVACAGGRPADGRVTLERLVEHEDRVELVIGVEAPEGDQTCPSNPPTPFTVELDEPLGDRILLDVAEDPEQELKAATEGS
jgi:hypothetical protein